MPEITGSLDFEVYCGTCGAAMCHKTSVSRGNQVSVDACEKCMENARTQGYDEGYEEARRKFEE